MKTDNLIQREGEELLHEKRFQYSSDLVKWANSTEGTDYIVSITLGNNGEYILFYIK
jgi:hypothetical protein